MMAMSTAQPKIQLLEYGCELKGTCKLDPNSINSSPPKKYSLMRTRMTLPHLLEYIILKAGHLKWTLSQYWCQDFAIHMYTWGEFTQGPKTQVPSPTHVCKFQHGGKVLTCEPQVTTKMWLIILKVGLSLFYAKIFAGLGLRVGYSFFLDPTCNTSPKPHLQKALPGRHPCHSWDLGFGTHVN